MIQLYCAFSIMLNVCSYEYRVRGPHAVLLTTGPGSFTESQIWRVVPEVCQDFLHLLGLSGRALGSPGQSSATKMQHAGFLLLIA